MSDGTSPPGRPAYLAFLPAFLFETDPSKARYVVKAWLTALLPAMLLSILAGLIFPGAERPDFPLRGAMLPVTMVLLVVVAPLIETLMMAPVVLAMNRWAGPGPAVVANAILWGVLHSLQRPVWGLVVWWPFLILSIAFLTWRSRGLGTAITLVTVVHGLQNSVPAALLLMTATGTAPV